MKAVIYARYSSEGQTENSIEGQLRECKPDTGKHNLTYAQKQLTETELGIENMLNAI